LFKSLHIPEATVWFWRADYNYGEPSAPGESYNIAKSVDGTPRPAFYTLQIDDSPPQMETRLTISLRAQLTILKPEGEGWRLLADLVYKKSQIIQLTKPTFITQY